MLKAMWFAIKIGLFVAAALWLVEREGQIRIQWLDYIVTIEMGLFLLLCVVLLFLSLFLYKLLGFVLGIPDFFARYQYKKRQEKGENALMLGLSAIAAGDQKSAAKNTKLAIKYLPKNHGLSLLLQAQNYRIQGQEKEAMKIFVQLVDHPDAGFLGVRGLLKAALNHHDYDTAEKLIDKGLEMQPKTRWLLELSYRLALQKQNWDKAKSLLKKSHKLGLFSKEELHDELAAMDMADAEFCEVQGWGQAAYEKVQAAYDRSKRFVPAICVYAQYKADRGDYKGACKLIEKAWKKEPHEAYVHVWRGLIEPSKADQPVQVMKHMSRLSHLGGDIALAYREAARAALNAALWGDAKELFECALKLGSSAELYHLMAQLEERTGGDEEKIKHYYECALSARSDAHWVNPENGQVYNRWIAILPDGSFNKLIWDIAEKYSDMNVGVIAHKGSDYLISSDLLDNL